ncbi:MAG: hypothetical protein JO199_02015, partial [Candidatus Eremiobacteraeota bacterium]|nr:hypothetical protein [Candidatus Eremiobacteraeota bacterium]
NAMKAATAMHLTSVPFTYAYAGGSGTDVLPTPQFLVWVKQQVLRGNPVIAGVYENAVVLGSAKPDGQYDHIVSVIGVGSNHPLSANGTTYRPDDYLIFSDNGLYGPNPPNTLPYSQLPPFYYPNTWNGGGGYPDVDTYANYAFGAFQKTRKHASASQSSYSLPVNSKANGYPGNFGLAVTGVMDYSHETLPVSLTVSPVLEYPYVSEGSASNPSPTAPPAMPIALTVKVSGLVAGAKYELYEYDGTPSEPFARVPNGQFNALAAVATNSWSFTATRASFTISPTPKPGGSYASNDSVAFRAVPASGP